MYSVASRSIAGWIHDDIVESFQCIHIRSLPEAKLDDDLWWCFLEICIHWVIRNHPVCLHLRSGAYKCASSSSVLNRSEWHAKSVLEGIKELGKCEVRLPLGSGTVLHIHVSTFYTNWIWWVIETEAIMTAWPWFSEIAHCFRLESSNVLKGLLMCLIVILASAGSSALTMTLQILHVHWTTDQPAGQIKSTIQLVCSWFIHSTCNIQLILSTVPFFQILIMCTLFIDYCNQCRVPSRWWT